MFGESLEILSMIDIGENKSWEIAQKLDVPIHRYRALIRRLVELRFIHYDDRDYSYSLTSRGDNVIKFAGSQICAPA